MFTCIFMLHGLLHTVHYVKFQANNVIFRCICHGNTFGPHCKILSRHFYGKSFRRRKGSPSIWLPGFPTCSRVHLSFYVFPNKDEGTLLFVESTQDRDNKFLSLQIFNGHPFLKVKTQATKKERMLKVEKNVVDGQWHRIDVTWSNGVSRNLSSRIIKKYFSRRAKVKSSISKISNAVSFYSILQ